MKKVLLFVVFICQIVGANAQDIWNPIPSHKSFSKEIIMSRSSTPETYKLYQIDNKMLKENLSKATSRTSSNNTKVIVHLPTPNGLQRFFVNEASVFSDALAKKFPSIKSYVGVGIDDPTALARFSNSSAGFHGMVSSAKSPLYFIDPYTKDSNVSIAYVKSVKKKGEFECLISDTKKLAKRGTVTSSPFKHDGNLRTYRLALVATGEYSQKHLGFQQVANDATDAVKKAAVLAAMNTTMTRVNGVFERDLGITMQLVPNNSNLIFLNAATDELTNDNADILIDQSQKKCDAIIGNANYDIGHTFGTSGDGLAGLAVVCVNNLKAKGITGSSSPINDTFDIDYVAHEMGHQFGANHTQNNDCNRNNATAVEPGGASTIMGYAGICSPNVQNQSDAYFHAISIAEIWNVVTTSGNCGVVTITGNNVPVANAGNDFTIPKSTPFILKGSATDADIGNSLTYNWEQTDNHIATMPPQNTNTLGPMFRSMPSSTSPNRYMPNIDTVLGGNVTSTWEVVPAVSRELNFSLTVRDNVANGGATDRDDVKITVEGSAGPFIVTSQAVTTTLLGNSTQTITWEVSSTNVAPINCTHVNILLSIDGGQTFPHVLKSNTANDGTEQVTLPNETTTDARILVEAVNNVFYAVNPAKFSIDKTAGIDDELFVNFSMYPNPTNGEISLRFDLKSEDRSILLQLYDVHGRVISKKEFNNSSSKFSTILNYSHVAAGMYFLNIKNGFFSRTKKIIIK